MADADIQALLDTSGNGRGIRINRRAENTGTPAYRNYYVTPVVGPYAGRSRWVQTLASASDADTATAIVAALA